MPEGKRLAEERRVGGLGDDGEGRSVLRDGAHDEDHRLMKCHGGERVRVIGMGGDKAADGILTKPEPGQPRFEVGSVSRAIGRQMDFDRFETSGAHGHLDTGGQRLERLMRTRYGQIERARRRLPDPVQVNLGIRGSSIRHIIFRRPESSK